ncbi:MAG: WD40 repeat domain-containing protein [Planctomycetes bacterium]|nr:WD40 repeat domain-containing protein [Planctomycetota bacterium]
MRLGKWVQRHRAGAIAATLLLGAACAALGYNWFAAAENRRQAGVLLAQAETDAGRGDYDQAVRRAAEAARLLPDDERVVGKAELFQTQQIADVRAKEARRADAYRLIGESQKALRRDPQLGLLLALEAVGLEDAPKSRSAVLDALRSGFVTKTLGGHDKGLYQARFSPDGRYVATTGRDDPIALIHDPGTGRRIAALTGHSGWTFDAMFQPGGDLIATVSQDQTCKLWRVPDGTLVGTLTHRGAVEIVDWSADGKRLLTVCNEQQFTALVWDVQSQRPLAELTGHANSVQLARLSPDGKHAVTSGDSGFLRVFGVDTGAEVAQLRGHKTVTAIAFHADSQWLATADAAGTARVFEIPSGLLLRAVQHSDRVTSVCFGTGDRLLTASNDKTARLWDLGLLGEEHGDLRAPRELRTFTGHGGVVASARFDALAQLVVTADEDRRVIVFDAQTGAELARLDLPGIAKSAEFDPHGRVLALPRGQRSGAVVWDFTDTSGTVTMRHDQFVRAAFVADPHLVTVCEDGTVSTWMQPNGRFVDSFALRLGEREAVQAADLDPAGERLAVGTTSGRVAIFARKTGRLLFQLDGHKDRVRSVAFARDGRLLATCSDDRTVCVWNSLDPSCVLRQQLDQPVLACALSPDGILLGTVETGANAARLWTIADGSPRGSAGAHQGQVTWVGFRPTGDAAVVTTSVDRTWQLSDLTGRRLASGTADRPLDRAAFAADGLRLLTAGSSTNHAVQLWELRTDGQPSTPALTFTDHLAAVVSGTFTRDGSQVLTGSRDRTVRLWPTDPVGLARSLPLRALTSDEIAEIVAVSAAPPGPK